MAKAPEVLELARTRLLHLIREPELVFWTFIFPVMLAMVLGLAFKSRKADIVRVGILSTPEVTDWAEALDGDERLDIRRFEDEREALAQLRRGAILVLFDAAPDAVETTPRLRFDPTRPESDSARFRVEHVLQVSAGRKDVLETRVEEVEGTGSRYVDWLVPGLLGMNLMSTGIWGIGFAIVESRQKKLLKRFLVTPMRRPSFLLSFLLSRLVFMVLEVALLVAFAVLALGTPMRGDLGTFAVLCLAGAVSFAGLAVLVGSRVRTAEGAGGLIYLVFMPMGLASGVFFSYERFSDALVPFIKLLPLTALNDALRANVLEGSNLFQLGPQLAVLLGWGAVSFLIGLKIFRWS